MCLSCSQLFSVVVVEGSLAALYRLGFPLPALASMQEAGVQLTEASWNIRRTAAGLSVSLFWPSSPDSLSGSVVAPKLSKSKKRRKKLYNNSRPNVSDLDPVNAQSSSKAAHLVENSADCSGHECDKLQSSTYEHDKLHVSLSLCLQSPETIISESELSSPAAHDRDPVFYYKSSDIPGLCVQRGDGKLSWSPMKVSKSAVKVGIPSSSGDSDSDIDHCNSFDYQ